MKKQPTHKEVYSTIIVLALAAMLIEIVFKMQYADDVALGLLALAIFFYSGAKWVTIVWLKFAELLGSFNSKVLLSVLFFLFLVPIALLSRIFRKDTLQRKRNVEVKGSYFKQRNHKYQPDDFTNVF